MFALLLATSAIVISADAAARTEKRVERLASSNKEPYVSEPTAKQRVQLPEGYDQEEQKRIYKVWSKLVKDDETDIATLVNHVRDQRYSFTGDIGGNGYSSYDVGRVCLHILEYKLDPYAPGQHRTYVFFVIAKDPDAWLKENADKSLFDLQLQCLDWFLNEYKHDQDMAYERAKQRRDELARQGHPFPPRQNEPLKAVRLPK